MINLINKSANKVVRHTNWYNNILWGGAVKFWKPYSFGMDVINLGSGAGVNDFCYEDMPVKGANWALGPQSLVHDFNILKNYFSYLREGGAVIITICPFSGLISKYDKMHNFKYYSFLHPATIINFDESERQKALRIKSNPFKEISVYCIKQTTKEILGFLLRKIKPLKKISLEESADQMMNNWLKQFGILNLTDQPSEQHLKEIAERRGLLLEMVEFCKERSLNPYIVIPVFHKSLASLFPDSFKKNYMETLVAGVEAPVLDYMNDNLGLYDEYFSTAMFLNKLGARQFTNKVLNDIELL